MYYRRITCVMNIRTISSVLTAFKRLLRALAFFIQRVGLGAVKNTNFYNLDFIFSCSYFLIFLNPNQTMFELLCPNSVKTRKNFSLPIDTVGNTCYTHTYLNSR